MLHRLCPEATVTVDARSAALPPAAVLPDEAFAADFAVLLVVTVPEPDVVEAAELTAACVGAAARGTATGDGAETASVVGGARAAVVARGATVLGTGPAAVAADAVDDAGVVAAEATVAAVVGVGMPAGPAVVVSGAAVTGVEAVVTTFGVALAEATGRPAGSLAVEDDDPERLTPTTTPTMASAPTMPTSRGTKLASRRLGAPPPGRRGAGPWPAMTPLDCAHHDRHRFILAKPG